MIDSAISPGVRAPMSSPAGEWMRDVCPEHMPSEAITASPRLRLATRPTYGTSAWSAAVRAGSSSRPCDATTTADAPAHASTVSSPPTRVGVPADLLGDTGERERHRGAADDEHQRRGQHRLQEDLERAARQARVVHHELAGLAAPRASGVIRSSSDSPLSSSASPWARTVDSAHDPPTNPSIVPSGSTSASAPGFADVGASASTTRACTNGTRARAQLGRAVVDASISR